MQVELLPHDACLLVLSVHPADLGHTAGKSLQTPPQLVHVDILLVKPVLSACVLDDLAGVLVEGEAAAPELYV